MERDGRVRNQSNVFLFPPQPVQTSQTRALQEKDNAEALAFPLHTSMDALQMC